MVAVAVLVLIHHKSLIQLEIFLLMRGDNLVHLVAVEQDMLTYMLLAVLVISKREQIHLYQHKDILVQLFLLLVIVTMVAVAVAVLMELVVGDLITVLEVME